MTSALHPSLATPRLQAYFNDYGNYHQTRGNQITHFFGISFILIGLLGLLSSLVLGLGFWNPTETAYLRLDGGTLLILLVLPYYFYLDWKISIPYGFVIFGLYFLGRALPSTVCWTLFVSGWILQGVGHYRYEKRSPAFFKNFTHLLIGPLWIFAKMLHYTGDQKL